MSRARRSVAVCLVAATLAACGGDAPQPSASEPDAVVSLLGEPLPTFELPAETRAKLEADLAAAREAYGEDPADEERTIWLGRRLAYLGRYREAIEVFTAGLSAHPDSYRLLRHRGHRYITTRQLDLAIADLGRAATLIDGVPDAVEPDGAPNPAGIPRSTSHSNIWYHLGLAHYLTGDFAAAATAWESGMPFSSVNDDMSVADRYWLYLSLRRLGRDAEAAALLEPIREEMDILESFAYHDLLRMFRGDLSPDEVLAGVEDGVEDATRGYGVGAWALVEGQRDEAAATFRRVVEGDSWAAFGFIAAEAEIARGR